jgi:hypothetical protein
MEVATIQALGISRAGFMCADQYPDQYMMLKR